MSELGEREVSGPRILYWDIESTPMTTYTWSLWPKAISIDMIRENQEMMSFAAKWRGVDGVLFRSTFHHGREKMLQTAWDLLHEADAVVSWNGQDYDSKHFNRELFEAGIRPPSPYKELDLMRVVKKRMRFASNKLDHISRVLGLAGKNKVDFDLWLGCMAGDPKAWAKMRRYNKQDVVLLEQIHDQLMPWMPAGFNAGLYFEGEEDRCPACGGDDLKREGYAYTQVGRFQRYSCRACGKWSRSGKRVDGVDLRAVAS